MHRARLRVAIAVVGSIVAVSSMTREARAQTTLVQTLPESKSKVPFSPFGMEAPNMQAAARLAGCYSVTLGSWASSQAGDTVPVPSRVDLTAEPHKPIYIGFRLVAHTPGFPNVRQQSPPAWGPVGVDSLQVRAWADGSRSLFFFVRRQSDGVLRGTLRYFAAERREDETGRWMWETYPNAPVSLSPIACESNPAAAPADDPQQPRRSQRASVMQMLGTTRVEITYSRPVARGRALFGALVPWGRVWNPGADTATALSISAPLRIQGSVLAAGTYSVWAIPNERDWTIIFSSAQPVWHVPYPEGREVLRVRAVPERGAHMEALAYYFPRVDGLEATLDLHWGETVVPLRLVAAPNE